MFRVELYKWVDRADSHDALLIMKIFYWLSKDYVGFRVDFFIGFYKKECFSYCFGYYCWGLDCHDDDDYFDFALVIVYVSLDITFCEFLNKGFFIVYWFFSELKGYAFFKTCFQPDWMTNKLPG